MEGPDDTLGGIPIEFLQVFSWTARLFRRMWCRKKQNRYVEWCGALHRASVMAGMTPKRAGPEIGLSQKRKQELHHALEEHFAGKVYISTVDVLQYILIEPSFSTPDRVYLAFLAGMMYEPSAGFEAT